MKKIMSSGVQPGKATAVKAAGAKKPAKPAKIRSTDDLRKLSKDKYGK